MSRRVSACDPYHGEKLQTRIRIKGVDLKKNL